MSFGIKKIGRFFGRFRRKEDGGPTVEFTLVFVPFVVLSVSGFEMGLLMTRHVMLERGVDMAVREVRLNTGVQVSENDFKTMICNAAGMIPNCMTQLRLEMVNVDMWTQSSVNPTAIPRIASCTDISNPFVPARNFVNGQSDEMMIVRACGLFSPMLPEFGLGYFLSRMGPGDGYYRLVSTTAFVMEPV